MSTKRRIFTAFFIFFAAAGLLAVAEAKKPSKVAMLEQQTKANDSPPVKTEAKPRARKFLPVHHMSDY